MKRIMLVLVICLLNGCIGSVIGAAVDVTTEVIKVPFKVGGAIVDGVTGDDDDEKDD